MTKVFDTDPIDPRWQSPGGPSIEQPSDINEQDLLHDKVIGLGVMSIVTRQTWSF